MFEPLRRTSAHEDLFVERYDSLVRAALKVTAGDRQEALDLVHDAFVRFTVVRPSLDDIERLDAYLFVMLRNMYTSRVRRRGRAFEVSLSILDFDSLDIGLEALDVAGRLEARETLRAACHYGCVRKQSAKVGSVFLLRFFHGYLPSEIARITRLSTAIVDELVFRARREVKLFVQHPERLAFMAPGRSTCPPSPAVEDTDGSEEGLMRELRRLIFSDRHAHCWSKRDRQDLFGNDCTAPVAKEDLAALVGCPVCLDEVNTMLNVPKLGDRWPTDTLGPGTRSGSSERASRRLTSGRRRAHAVFEHRPRELRISVNGFELGSHTIGTQPSELALSANIGEPLALVELFSEQGLCLLFLDICPPPEGSVRQRRRVDLSDGRHAELDVTFGGPWPTVRATYVDPREESVAAADELTQDLSSSARAAQTHRRQAWTTRLFGLRPSPAIMLAGVIVIWLLFWTPGTHVSAAERIVDGIKWLVTELLGSPAKPTALEAPPPPPSIAPTALPNASIPNPRSSPRVAAARVTASQRMVLELSALARLQRVDAYLGQEVSFGPPNTARADVLAAVDGEARKQVLLDALGSVLRGTELRAEITDLRDAAGRSRAPNSDVESPTREYAFVKDRFAMFETLRRYFQHQREFQSAQSPGTAISVDDSQLDSDVRRFAIRVLDHSRRASQHAWALKHLEDRFPDAAVRTSSTEIQELWHTVVREHARGYAHEISLLRSALEPVVKTSGLRDAAAPQSSVARPAEMSGASSPIMVLLNRHRDLDAAIQTAFTIQPDGAGVNVIQAQAFWHLVDESEALAAQIATKPLARR